MNDRPDITPDLKVGALLDAYPELEETLVGIAPHFAKLRNPMLRKTVAKVTSLQQAAAVGGVTVGKLIGTLRSEAGLEAAEMGDEGGATSATERPAWVVDEANVETFDARAMIEAGEMPMARVMGSLDKLSAGEVYTFITPFAPAPLLDRIAAAGFEAWTECAGPEDFRTHCTPRG